MKSSPSPLFTVAPLAGIPCRLCDCSNRMQEIIGFHAMKRVSSDCKPQPAGGRLAVCTACGTVQKPADSTWLDEINSIYRAYDIYYQSGGVEAKVFTPASSGATRSLRLGAYLEPYLDASKSGSLLDVGCGSGAFLRAMSEIRPSWNLAGSDINHGYRQLVESIPHVSKFYTCSLDEIPGFFDCISFIHVVEHLADPYTMLKAVTNKLTDSGLLLVQVPDYRTNPFDLLIADHATHYSEETLPRLVTQSGFAIRQMTSSYIPKELTLLAQKTPVTTHDAIQANGTNESVVHEVMNALEWLSAIIEKYRALPPTKAHGVFGTSNAGVWLYNSLDGEVDFFVDEDTNRQSRRIFEKPIYAPADVPDDAHVMVAIAPVSAQTVAARMSTLNPNVTWHCP